MSSFTPQQFVENWRDTTLRERQTYQIHFIDVCRMVGHEAPNPSGVDARGNALTFDFGVKKDTGDQGFADVFYEGRFAVEYKGAGKHADLQAALNQLKQYRENLNNPPLLVVCDIENWEIHTNFNNAPHVVYAFKHHEILEPRVQRWLRAMFEEPQQLHPHRNTEQVTKDAASTFHGIAANMRQWEAAPERIAHFLTKLVFCLFAEDVGLLPITDSGRGILSEIVEQTYRKPSDFVFYATQLFEAMRDGGRVMFHDIRYFDGQLFDDVTVEELSLEALRELRKAASLDWSAVEPAIFGTLFERSLDPAKRAQLGAHYTSRDDILLIVEPVLMQPLRREWDAIRQEAAPLRDKYDEALKTSNRRNIQTTQSQLLALRERMLHDLREVQVLDPACGSGNFLYVSLQLLMDMEKAIITDPLFVGLPLAFPEVHPRHMYGIEKDAIAHDLASIVAWIGYIQWRQNNGYLVFQEPILEPLADNIRLMDAILAYDESGNPVEPAWPEADVIVGNPPFLGGNMIRQELGDYVDRLFALYEDRVPAFADLVCYWFEKAREQLERGNLKRAGLLATNSIRGGANREVLKRIKTTGDIFMAWSDRDWILEGAAVRVSMVGFDKGEEQEKRLDGLSVATINPDLSASVDITKAEHLDVNERLCFMGPSPKGPFDIDEQVASKMLAARNANGKSNSDVIRPVVSGVDIVQPSRQKWTIDFGLMSIEEARGYEIPFSYIQTNVYPVRSKNRRAAYAEKWWQYAEVRPGLRQAVRDKTRFIVTPTLSKHRVFIWGEPKTLYNQQVIIFARDDDYFFGVLHSRLHEVWSLRMGTWLGVGNDPRYTPTTTFETFPFPWPPGHEATSSPAYQAIASAAKQLHEERHAWLNPPGVSGKALQERTLTNLYNALNVWRGVEKIRVMADAADFAPRLDDLHRTLDMAVCDAYGWPHEILADDEEILRRLLVLNLERAG